MILLHPNVQKKKIGFWWFYCILMFNCTVSNATVTKIKYGHPWPNKVIKRSQNTVHKVTYGFNVQSVQIFGRSLGLFMQS